MQKSNKGITLVALIITIIVLVILAGVTISVMSNEGILHNTEQVKETYKLSTYNEYIENIKFEAFLEMKSDNIDTILGVIVKEKLEKEQWVSSVKDKTENSNLNDNQLQVITKDGFEIIVELNEEKTEITKLDRIQIPHKDKMTYYFDYEALKEGYIENYSTGEVGIKTVNATLSDNSIYFSGNNSSYAYTESQLNDNDYFTVYYVAKFDKVYSNNYVITTLSKNTSNSFGIGVGRFGTGTNGTNVVFPMISNTSNGYQTNYDVKNYYVYTILYNGNKAFFYLNGNKVAEMNANNILSRFYFASYLKRSDNKAYGGSLIRYKQFAFVDDIHTDAQIKENSDFLYNKYLK